MPKSGCLRSRLPASVPQVRQKLYTSAVGKWRRYKEQLRPVSDQLKPLIDAYEAELEALDASAAAQGAAKDEL